MKRVCKNHESLWTMKRVHGPYKRVYRPYKRVYGPHNQQTLAVDNKVNKGESSKWMLQQL